MAGKVRNLSKFLLLALIVVVISLYVVSKFTDFRRAEVVQAPGAGAAGEEAGETVGPAEPALAPAGPAGAGAPEGQGPGASTAATAASPGAPASGAAASPPEGPGVVVPFGLPSESATAGELAGLGFMDYRLERERSRAQEAEWLKDMSQDPDADPEARAEAGRRLLELTTLGAREAELENLIRAKGFKDALVFLFSSSAVVLVQAGQLTQGEVARIGDAVARGADLRLEDISIMCRPR